MPVVIIGSLAVLAVASGWAANETGEAVEKSANATVKTAIVVGGLYLAYRYIKR